jgi:aspartate kinase
MKFGGTSVANAVCIRQVAEILSAAVSDGPVVAVVSAMGGVTNRLIEASLMSASGGINASLELEESIRKQHQEAIEAIVEDQHKRAQYEVELHQIIEEVTSLCRGIALLRELTPRALDAISSAGERLCARLLAISLRERAVNAVAVDATELIVTTNHSGRAEPLMTQTRERASAKLQPIIAEGVVPVVTGFIGATVDGMLTTLGRGGSDYSATILGASLDAIEIIIWTDVDGVLTADPRLVPEARRLDEISYDEAAELAYFGAKVLHPKTLRPVSEAGIPVWIRNSFKPKLSGTKITAMGHPTRRGVKAITAMSNVALITVGGRGIVGLPGVAARTFTAAANAQANVLLISQSSSGNDICFIVDVRDADRTVSELRSMFDSDLAQNAVEHIVLDVDIAIVAVVGDHMRGTPGIAGRIFGALGRRGINIIAIAQGSSEYNVSLVIEARLMREVVQVLHNEFGLERRASRFESIKTESAFAGF